MFDAVVFVILMLALLNLIQAALFIHQQYEKESLRDFLKSLNFQEGELEALAVKGGDN